MPTVAADRWGRVQSDVFVGRSVLATLKTYAESPRYSAAKWATQL